MQREMEWIENGIRFLGGTYGLKIPFVNGELRRQFESIGAGVEAVRFEIHLSVPPEPLISYTFLPRQFKGFVPLIVPVREKMAHHELTWRLAVERDEETKGRNPERWKRVGTRSTGRPFISMFGMSIWAREDLRSRGVILSYDPECGRGVIQSGARLAFLGAWMKEGVPETGLEVEFLPVARVMEGLQAREIRPCHEDFYRCTKPANSLDKYIRNG